MSAGRAGGARSRLARSQWLSALFLCAEYDMVASKVEALPSRAETAK